MKPGQCETWTILAKERNTKLDQQGNYSLEGGWGCGGSYSAVTLICMLHRALCTSKFDLPAGLPVLKKKLKRGIQLNEAFLSKLLKKGSNGDNCLDTLNFF